MTAVIYNITAVWATVAALFRAGLTKLVGFV